MQWWLNPDYQHHEKAMRPHFFLYTCRWMSVGTVCIFFSVGKNSYDRFFITRGYCNPRSSPIPPALDPAFDEHYHPPSFLHRVYEMWIIREYRRRKNNLIFALGVLHRQILNSFFRNFIAIVEYLSAKSRISHRNCISAALLTDAYYEMHKINSNEINLSLADHFTLTFN